MTLEKSSTEAPAVRSEPPPVGCRCSLGNPVIAASAAVPAYAASTGDTAGSEYGSS